MRRVGELNLNVHCTRALAASKANAALGSSSGSVHKAPTVIVDTPTQKDVKLLQQELTWLSAESEMRSKEMRTLRRQLEKVSAWCSCATALFNVRLMKALCLCVEYSGYSLRSPIQLTINRRDRAFGT